MVSIRLPLAALIMALAPMPAGAQISPLMTTPASFAVSGPLVTLSVTGSVESAPDLATLGTGVQTRAPTARDAMAANASQMDKLIATLRNAGIAAKDIQTSHINLAPQYDYSNQGNGGSPRFTGYEASNQLSVTVRDLAKAGDLVDRMVAVGATNVNGPTFGLVDGSGPEREARAKAVRLAAERAQFYAVAAGYRSARLMAISEGGEISRPPMPMMMAKAMDAGAPTRIEPGQIETAITLTFQYVLEK